MMLSCPAFAKTSGFLSYNKDSFSKKSEQKSKQSPIVIIADRMNTDQEAEITTAIGNVLVLQDGRSVLANKIIYDKKNDKLMAYGNVIVQDINADMIFSDSIEINRNNDSGLSKNARILTAASERVSAPTAIKYDKNRESFKKASYTPCKRCKDTLNPLWSLHSSAINKDSEKNYVEYIDTEVDFLGIPFFYLPYMYQPLKRASGFLIPGAGSSRGLGFFASSPYFSVINDSSDVLITPYFMSKGGKMLALEYREQLNAGFVKIEGAINKMPRKMEFFNEKIINKKGKKKKYKTGKIRPLRGYAKGDIKYNFNEHWRLSSKEYFVSDQTFFFSRPFFGVGANPQLESKTALEGFFAQPYSSHYFDVREIRYQCMLPGDGHFSTKGKYSPFIAPSGTYSYISEDTGVGYFIINVETLSLYRKVGDEMQRGTLECIYQFPITSDYGDIITPFIRAQGSGYSINLFNQYKKYADYDPVRTVLINKKTKERYHAKSNATRFIGLPQTGIEIMRPLSFIDPSCMISPTVQFIVAPTVEEYDSIPNESSQGVDFSEGNLFKENRYPGRDRLDGGSRVNYGAEIDKSFANDFHIDASIGQSYSFSKPIAKLAPLGLLKGFSHIIGRIATHAFSDQFNVVYRFRFANHELTPMVQELSFRAGPSVFHVTGSYLFINKKASLIKNYTGMNQASVGINSHFSQFWSASVGVTFNIDKNALVNKRTKTRRSGTRMLGQKIELLYRDECFTTSAGVYRSFVKYRDIKPGYTVLFSIVFKNLGGLNQNVGSIFNPGASQGNISSIFNNVRSARVGQ